MLCCVSNNHSDLGGVWHNKGLLCLFLFVCLFVFIFIFLLLLLVHDGSSVTRQMEQQLFEGLPVDVEE